MSKGMEELYHWLQKLKFIEKAEVGNQEPAREFR